MTIKPTELENAVVQEFDNYLGEVTSNRSSGALEKLIAHDYLRLLKTYLDYGETLPMATTQQMSDEELLEKYLSHFYLPEKLKEVGILHRDVLVEYIKALMYQFEEALSPSDMDHFKEQSFQVLTQATDSLVERFNEFRNKVQASSKEQEAIRKKLLLVENPWNVYKEQLLELQGQIAQMVKDKDHLPEMGASIEGIKAFFGNIYQKNQSLADHFITGYSQLKEPLSKKNVKWYLQKIDQVSEASQALGNGEINYEAIEAMQFPVSVIRAGILGEDGVLEIREFNLKKGFRKWMDYGLVPLWAKLIDQENTFRIKTQVRLANLNNSLQLYEQSGLEGENDRIQLALNDLAEDAASFKRTSGELIGEIEKKLREGLSLLNLVKGGKFMETPLQSAIDFGHRTLYASAKKALNKYLKLAFRWYESAGKQDARSLFEVALSSIEQRIGNLEPDRYDSIFLNKNFLGDLFLVERQHEMMMVEDNIISWEKGFARSVLVTGSPLCGKSTFIDSIGRQYFKSNWVQLAPNGEAVVDGRKFGVTVDLGAALQYIKNHNLQSTKLAICIDNLELWKDQEHSIYDNVRALMQFADNESDEFFLIVGAPGFFVNHLETRLGFLQHFTTTVDLSKAGKEEIYKAVMTRHQATHRQLINEKGVNLGEKRLSYFVNWLARKHQYNLGSVLQAWTYHTIQLSDQEIIITKSIQDFVDFFTPHEKIILKQLLLYTTTSELEIKMLVGNVYEESFRSSLKRLINSNILDRDLKGRLSIKPMFINDIEEIIKQS